MDFTNSTISTIFTTAILTNQASTITKILNLKYMSAILGLPQERHQAKYLNLLIVIGIPFPRMLSRYFRLSGAVILILMYLIDNSNM